MGIYSVSSLFPCFTASSPTWFSNSYLCPWRCGAEEGRNRADKALCTSFLSLLLMSSYFFWSKASKLNPFHRWLMWVPQVSLRTDYISRDRMVLPAQLWSSPGQNMTWLYMNPRMSEYVVSRKHVHSYLSPTTGIQFIWSSFCSVLPYKDRAWSFQNVPFWFIWKLVNPPISEPQKT